MMHLILLHFCILEQLLGTLMQPSSFPGKHKQQNHLDIENPFAAKLNPILTLKTALSPRTQEWKATQGARLDGKKFNGGCYKVRELCDKPANKYDGNSLLLARQLAPFWEQM